MSFITEDEYSEKTFDSLDLRAEALDGRVFENCDFVKCAFGPTKRCRFIDCRFQGCDLSNWQLHDSTFRNVSFKDCKMLGVNWANAGTLSHLAFDACVLNLASFVGIDLRKCALRQCLAKEADFADANLSEVDCRGTDFAGARFSQTNLTKADLRNAKNYSIRADGNKIKKAKFSLPEATLLLYGLDIELEE